MGETSNMHKMFQPYIRKRKVSNKTNWHGAASMIHVHPNTNPKYSPDLSYKDPRSDELFEQTVIRTQDVVVDLLKRVQELEDKLNAKDT